MNKIVEDCCAGREIKKAMKMVSKDLIEGCKKFSILANESASKKDIKIFNISCIMFAVSAVEAKLNESISIIDICYSDETDKVWKPLIPLIINKLCIEEKWDFVSDFDKKRKWDASAEPFQSFLIIRSLRNELVHYKGNFLGKDEVPVVKLKSLMELFKIKSSAIFIEDDCSTWIEDLLITPTLGCWVYKKLNELLSYR